MWVAVGGRGTKYGPIIGAIIVNMLKSYTTQAFPESWLIILGFIFVFVVLLMPDGIVGLPNTIKKWRQNGFQSLRFKSLIKRFI